MFGGCVRGRERGGEGRKGKGCRGQKLTMKACIRGGEKPVKAWCEPSERILSFLPMSTTS